jgi:hypothetical protein
MRSLVVLDAGYSDLTRVVGGLVRLAKGDKLSLVVNQSHTFTPDFWSTIFSGLETPEGLSDVDFLRVLSIADLTPIMVVDGPGNTVDVMRNLVKLVRDQHFIPDFPFRFIAVASRDPDWASEQIRLVNESLYGGE